MNVSTYLAAEFGNISLFQDTIEWCTGFPSRSSNSVVGPLGWSHGTGTLLYLLVNTALELHYWCPWYQGTLNEVIKNVPRCFSAPWQLAPLFGLKLLFLSASSLLELTILKLKVAIVLHWVRRFEGIETSIINYYGHMQWRNGASCLPS